MFFFTIYTFMVLENTLIHNRYIIAENSYHGWNFKITFTKFQYHFQENEKNLVILCALLMTLFEREPIFYRIGYIPCLVLLTLFLRRYKEKRVGWYKCNFATRGTILKSYLL